MGASPAIDWETAQRIGELVAGSPANGGVRAHTVQPLAHDFAHRVSDYTGLALPAELPPLEAVDRRSWIGANLATMRPLLDSVAQSVAPGEAEPAKQTGAISGSLQAVSGHLLGAQLGAVTGLLSQRVLGQYDISLLDPTATPRLLLVAPNLAGAAANLGVDRQELVAWVAIHEITHAVQFSGAPWLREHLGAMIGELLAGLQISLGGRASDGDTGATPAGKGSLDPRRMVPSGRELRDLLERGRRGELLRITLGEDRWRVFERMQSTMSLIEGHAEHTMDAVGAQVLPSLPRLRAAMTRRRETRGLPWRVLERLLGLELKLRQYEVGRRFCDAVVQKGGPETLAIAWRSPAELPSACELAQPIRWLERVSVPA